MPAVETVFAESRLPLPDRTQGKVRESYRLGIGRRLLVASDRLSAFDRVLGMVPYKGQVLTELSAWWFQQTGHIVENHFLSLPDANAMEVVEAVPLPIEVVVRGYITGVTGTSLWYRYELGERDIYGHHLPEGLQKNEALARPLVTPTTKGGPTGHDERLTCVEVVESGYLDFDTWNRVHSAALDLFVYGSRVAANRGLLLVDTKYEFGRTGDGRVLLIDEVHTPDSSRFWRADTYLKRWTGGLEPESLDKEAVRLAYAAVGYRGQGDPPEMPAELWLRASALYRNVFERLTGEKFVPQDYPVGPRLERNLRRLGL